MDPEDQQGLEGQVDHLGIQFINIICSSRVIHISDAIQINRIN